MSKFGVRGSSYNLGRFAKDCETIGWVHNVRVTNDRIDSDRGLYFMTDNSWRHSYSLAGPTFAHTLRKESVVGGENLGGIFLDRIFNIDSSTDYNEALSYAHNIYDKFYNLQTEVSMGELLTVKKDLVLKAAEQCPTFKGIAKTLFPELYDIEWDQSKWYAFHDPRGSIYVFSGVKIVDEVNENQNDQRQFLWSNLGSGNNWNGLHRTFADAVKSVGKSNVKSFNSRKELVNYISQNM